MLKILLASSQTAAQAFHAADNPVDSELLADLERVIERTRRALTMLDERLRTQSSGGGRPYALNSRKHPGGDGGSDVWLAERVARNDAIFRVANHGISVAAEEFDVTGEHPVDLRVRGRGVS